MPLKELRKLQAMLELTDEEKSLCGRNKVILEMNRASKKAFRSKSVNKFKTEAEYREQLRKKYKIKPVIEFIR
jgi:hypothetical protein